MVGRNVPTTVQPMGNSLTSRIFIISIVDQKNLKFGMMITRVNTTVQKKQQTVAIATSLDEIDFSARITQRVHIEADTRLLDLLPYKLTEQLL